MSPMSWYQKVTEEEMPHCERCNRVIEDDADDNGDLCQDCYDDLMDEKADCKEEEE